jgi:hypothetical protein
LNLVTKTGKVYEFFMLDNYEFYQEDDVTYFKNLYYKVIPVFRRNVLPKNINNRTKGGKKYKRKTRKTRKTRK